jgi:ACR3 family arsenite transporter
MDRLPPLPGHPARRGRRRDRGGLVSPAVRRRLAGDVEPGAGDAAVGDRVVAGPGLARTFYLRVLPGWLGLDTQDVQFSTWEITKAVLIFLGIPLVAGYLTRRIGIRSKGHDWYEQRFLPRVGPFALYGLLFTIVVMFALQGDAITSDPASVVRIAVPLLVYFAAMWGVSFAIGVRARLGYPKTATVAFTAAGNNFELAIAVSIGVWGVTSGQALAGVIGPLIEVPALVALVYVSLWLRHRIPAALTPADPDRLTADRPAGAGPTG